jgi:hypothetical protein
VRDEHRVERRLTERKGASLLDQRILVPRPSPATFCVTAAPTDRQ